GAADGARLGRRAACRATGAPGFGSGVRGSRVTRAGAGPYGAGARPRAGKPARPVHAGGPRLVPWSVARPRAGNASRTDGPRQEPDRIMMKTLLTLVAALAVAAMAPAQTLTVGKPAPPLTIDHWVKGERVTELAGDKVYLVEF